MAQEPNTNGHMKTMEKNMYTLCKPEKRKFGRRKSFDVGKH
jgi:hypothetical protein